MIILYLPWKALFGKIGLFMKKRKELLDIMRVIVLFLLKNFAKRVKVWTAGLTVYVYINVKLVWTLRKLKKLCTDQVYILLQYTTRFGVIYFFTTTLYNNKVNINIYIFK